MITWKKEYEAEYDLTERKLRLSGLTHGKLSLKVIYMRLIVTYIKCCCKNEDNCTKIN